MVIFATAIMTSCPFLPTGKIGIEAALVGRLSDEVAAWRKRCLLRITSAQMIPVLFLPFQIPSIVGAMQE